MAITPLVKVIDFNVTDSTTDAAVIQAVLTATTIAHVYGWAVIPLSNSRLRCTIIYG